MRGSKALLLSRYGLDVQPYNTEDVDITWETCTLRTWLNRAFMNKAFTAEEQAGIVLTSVDNNISQGYSRWNTNGGNNTQDKIFLLSHAEANEYFGVTYLSSNTKPRVAPTAYAFQQGAHAKSDYRTADGAAAWWWLRSPGGRQKDASCVVTDGSFFDTNVSRDGACVRPALWIDLESGILDSRNTAL